MSKQSAGKARASEPKRALFSVRISTATIARVKAYAFATGRKNQDIAEAAIEKYLRELKLGPDESRKIKALLGE